MIYLEDYLDKLYEEIEKGTKTLKESKGDRTKLVAEMKEVFKKTIVHEEEKVALASQTYDMVDKHIRRLDENLVKFDMDMAHLNASIKEQTVSKKRKINDSPPKANVPETRKRERRATRRVSVDNGKDSEYSSSENGKAAIPGLSEMPLDPNEPTYCYCGQVSFGEMIGCDNEGCEIEWFHYDCVGLKSVPKGKWYCHECLTKRKKGLLKQ